MEINKEAIAEFLVLRYIIGDKTFQNGKKAELPSIPPFETYENATIEDVEENLKESLHKQIKNKKRIGISLSGGKDSRLLLSMIKSLGIDATAVTIGDIPGRDEEKVAKKVAK